MHAAGACFDLGSSVFRLVLTSRERAPVPSLQVNADGPTDADRTLAVLSFHSLVKVNIESPLGQWEHSSTLHDSMGPVIFLKL